MPVKYILAEKGKPSDPSEPKKYYAQTKSTGETLLRGLSNKVSKVSTLSSIDIAAAVEAMLFIIPEELLEGRIVKLGEFGSFYTVIKGSGADNAEDFTISMIDKLVVKFRPGKLITRELKNAVFEKA